MGAKHISFLDDTLTLSESRTLDLCERIKPLKIKWDCYIRVHVTEDMIVAMKEAGCVEVRIGFESGNNEILKRIKKNTTIEEARKAMKILKKHDLKTYGFFMLGLPGDTKKTTEDTINFAIELSPHVASFCVTTPFPGTEMFNEYVEKDWIPKDMNWKNMTVNNSELTRTDSLTPKEILKYYKKANRRFFFRPEYFIQLAVYFLKNPYKLIGYLKRLIQKIF
jgi:radical SAM superfamily enzyme YgiQ (UPF0313 family)